MEIRIDAIRLLLDARFGVFQYGGVLGPDKPWPTYNCDPVHQQRQRQIQATQLLVEIDKSSINQLDGSSYAVFNPVW